jgi:ribonuclease HII
MICGVDEAGRGPVIGPLVVAGVLVSSSGLKRLGELGVRDSKLHTPAQREDLYKKLTGFVDFHSIRIQAADLDTLMSLKKLNHIEAREFARIVDKLSPSIAYIDAADVSPGNFRRTMLLYLKSQPRLVVEHKADERYPVVSAASIIAKVERDREIKRLHKIHGDFGSGYTSDPKTQKFLETCFRETHSFPDCVRKKWKTTIRASNLKLEEFY